MALGIPWTPHRHLQVPAGRHTAEHGKALLWVLGQAAGVRVPEPLEEATTWLSAVSGAVQLIYLPEVVQNLLLLLWFLRWLRISSNSRDLHSPEKHGLP